jgi:hypothetical protein
MSVLHNSLLLGAAAGAAGYQIQRSLRFNSSDSAYLSRTPGSAGNRKTWTWAGWVKRSALGGDNSLFTAYGNGTQSAGIYFSNDTLTDSLNIYLNYSGGTWTSYLITAQLFRDPSAWYHIVVALDTTQATSTNRIKLYVNGTQVTTFNSSAYPSQNEDGFVNQAQLHEIGKLVGNNYYMDGYLADVYFINGQALDPSSFTETDATTGQLIPKAYTGSYGTNGFHLDFADNSAATATTLGKDTSGNGNNWTPNNLSVTAGAGNDSLVDVPTNGAQTDTGVGGEVRGNYATFNALALNGNTLTNGNLSYLAGAANKPTLTTFGIPASGKWYFEFTDVDSSGSFTGGVGTELVSVSSYLGSDANGWAYQTHPSNAGYHNSGVFTTTGRINGAGSNTILGVAIDRDAQKIWFSVNGTFVNSGAPASGTNAQYSNLPTSGFLLPGASTNNAANIHFNAGQRPFAYTAPSGFKALCTANLPAPLVTKPSTVMDVVLYTGTGSSLTLPYASSTPTSIAFTPDLVWIKGRSGATDHALYDAVRDVQKDLVSNSTAAETTQSTGLTAFGTNTFTIGSLAKLNTSSATYAAWCWDAGTTTDTNNTAGSITSSVRANATAGFSVVTYTGNGTQNATVGHGLGVKPALHIIKNRSSASNWVVLTQSIDGSLDYAYLNSTAAFGNAAQNAPTSTVFSVWNDTDSNANGSNYVAYCFAPVVGYSSFGSYTGNGSSQFVYLGFRPKFWMHKRTDSTGSWMMVDAVRSSYNVAQDQLYANLSNADSQYGGSGILDFVSNGVVLKSTGGDVNGSSIPYIYIAFAESPFNYSRAR